MTVLAVAAALFSIGAASIICYVVARVIGMEPTVLGGVLSGLGLTVVLHAGLLLPLEGPLWPDKRDRRSVHITRSLVDGPWSAARKAVHAAGQFEDLRDQTIATVRKLLWENRHNIDQVVPHMERLATTTAQAASAREAQDQAVRATLEAEKSH